MRSITLILIMIILTTCTSKFSNIKSIKKISDYRGHPIIGSWSMNAKGCKETYKFLFDGTRMVFSNEEIAKARYEISLEPLETGFYALKDEVIEDNGKPDCDGSRSNMVGDVVNVFVKFDSNEEQFIICFKQSLSRCFGPFYKDN